jgi:glycosyltransferase involved in cell wall biosynthesis
MPKRLRVLLSAYYFSPYRGSESAVGWNLATRLAKYSDVTVIFGDLSSNRPMLADWERWCAEHPEGIPGLNAVHVAADSATVAIHDLHALPGLWFLYYRAYRRWQRQVLEVARRLHAEEPFDLAHHLTVIGYREPGELWNLGIPFVWGPINGAAMTPWKFLPGFGWMGLYRHITRNVLNAVQMRVSKRPRAAAKAAAKIWTVTKEDQDMVERLWGCETERMIETGSTPDPEAAERAFAAGEVLKLMWCGMIEDRKALHLLLEALARQRTGHSFMLQVVGAGPAEPRCRALVRKLGLADRVVWHGRVEHRTVRTLMHDCHLLVHTAIREGTPHVVLEALSSGLPVLCHDACGMGTAVDESCGLKIPLRSPGQSVAGFDAALRSIHETPERVGELSRGALARARALTWENLARRILKTYEEAARPTQSPP